MSAETDAERPRCSIDGCDRPAKHRGWCKRHYRRWQRHGDPRGGRATSPGEPAAYFHEHVNDRGDECIEWPFATTGKMGYGHFTVDGEVKYVHVEACILAHGPRPPGKQAAHRCGNPRCFRPSHVRWATQRENSADTLAHGTRLRGTQIHQSKLDERSVQLIRAARAFGFQGRVVAGWYGVDPSTVCDVIRGRNWSWLEDYWTPGAAEDTRTG